MIFLRRKSTMIAIVIVVLFMILFSQYKQYQITSTKKINPTALFDYDNEQTQTQPKTTEPLPKVSINVVHEKPKRQFQLNQTLWKSTFLKEWNCWESSEERDYFDYPIILTSLGNREISENFTGHECDVPCVYTSSYDWEERADVFSMRHFMSSGSIPRHKHCDYQRSVFLSMESRYSAPYTVAHRGPFDWVWSQNLQSEIVAGYWSTRSLWDSKPLLYDDKDQLSMAAAFISNCNDAAQRLETIDLLEKQGVRLSKYGQCFDTGRWKGDKKKVLQKTKFTLSFENTVERDYVSEKYWHALNAGSVPIVLGAPNIKEFEPLPGTILVVNDPDDVKNLSKQIKAIASNRTLYNHMLRWKIPGKEKASSRFLALSDNGAVHPHCYACIKAADVFSFETFDRDEEKPSGKNITKQQNRNSMEEPFFRIRERGSFYYRKISPLPKNLPELYSMIFTAFEGYTPLFAKYRPYDGNLTIHSIVPSGTTLYDSVFFGPEYPNNSKPLLTNEALVKRLKPGTRWDVYFV